MAPRRDIVLMTSERTTEKAVAAALKGASAPLPAVCGRLGDLVNELERRHPAAALVDLDPQPRATLKELDRIVSRHAGTRFVMLSRNVENDLMLEAMQVGARHFLGKQQIAAELTAVLARLLGEHEPAGSGGATVTVLSVSGGCGATTVAVNLANELQAGRQKPTLLVDLDVAYGAMGTCLDLHGEYGVADLLANAGRIDEELLRSTALAYSDNLHVLLSPASIDYAQPKELAFAALPEALDVCRETYDYTVLDAPRVSMDIAAGLAARSRLTLLVFQLSVKDLRLGKAMWSALQAREVRADRVIGVANRYRRWKQMVTLEEAGKALPGLSLVTVGNDFRSSILSSNYGQPLSLAAPRSGLRRDIQALGGRCL